jgi:2-polyprenyl-3-methyl-5-hydroxy-6-metoxy-1,4-benzoquinol methylase
MQRVRCAICGSDDSELFGARPARADVLHSRFVRCRKCGFVYADPRADEDEARRFYSSVEDRDPDSRDRDLESAEWKSAIASRQRTLRRAEALLEPTGSKIRMLDIGFGDGSALAAGHDLGWDVAGVEQAEWRVAAVGSQLPFADVSVGDVGQLGADVQPFDIVYSWHVVEHVLDIDAWLASVAAHTREGGVVVLGTESADALFGRLFRGLFRILGKTPWPPTSTDHTYWFSAGSLRALLERAGFRETEVIVYENSPVAIVRAESVRRLRNPRWAFHFLLYLTAALVAQIRPSLGGKLIVLAVKPQSRVPG